VARAVSGLGVRRVKRATVPEALEAYLPHLRREGRFDTARAAEGRFKTVILADSVADLDVEEVTRDDFPGKARSADKRDFVYIKRRDEYRCSADLLGFRCFGAPSVTVPFCASKSARMPCMAGLLVSI
jgi:hypothetical protein